MAAMKCIDPQRLLDATGGPAAIFAGCFDGSFAVSFDLGYFRTKILKNT